MPPVNLAFVTKVRVAFCPFSNVSACRYHPLRPPTPPSLPVHGRWASRTWLQGEDNEEASQAEGEWHGRTACAHVAEQQR